jgi:signal transduction histidine kinase
MTDARRARLPWVCWSIVTLLSAGIVLLSAVNHTLDDETYFGVVLIAMALSYATVGAVLASRSPRNAIGWLMIVVGLSISITGFATEYTVYGYENTGDPVPTLGPLVALASNTFWLPMFASLILLVLLYPSGRVPGPRWRFVPPAIIGFCSVAFLAGLFYPGPIDLDVQVTIENPLGVQAIASIVDLVATIAYSGFLFLGGPAAIAALVVRYRRSRGEERQQIRWLAYVVGTTVIVVISGLVTALIVGESFGESLAAALFVLVGFGLVGIGVPIAMGVAVMRYRLYDLDLVVKKTVVFAVVAGTLTIVALAAALAVPVLVVGAGLSGWEFGLLMFGVLLGTITGPLRRWARRIADRLVYGGRATPYEVLTQFAERVGETYATEDVLPRMAHVVGRATGAVAARVLLRVGAEQREVARWPDDRDLDAPELVVPVIHQTEELGALAVSMPASDPMNPAKERLVRDLAAQAGPVLRNVRLIEELRASRQRLVAAQDQERRRIERNIHDGAQQQLVALAVKLRLADAFVGKDEAKAHAMLVDLQAETGEALENLRDLARGIYPPLLADRGLVAALEGQARKSPIPVSVDGDGVGRYAQEVEAAVYFCALEALQNVAKYAEASRVLVRLTAPDGQLRFEVEDDGRGFDPGATGYGTGLQGMADRLDAIGGTLDVESVPGSGTTVRGRVPLAAGTSR